MIKKRREPRFPRFPAFFLSVFYIKSGPAGTVLR